MGSTPFTLNRQVALLTKHEKQSVIHPLLAAAFDTAILQTDAFDTDKLGTFDQRVPRVLSPVETALKKAYLACELTGQTQGLGSEGSFNGTIAGATLNQEVLAFVDTERDLQVIGFAQQYISLRAIEAQDEVALGEQMQPFIEQYADAQKWMLKQDGKWLKGLSFSELLASIKHWPCIIEPDFRAMHCIERQTTIEMACKDLIRCLSSHCPKCSAVNFVAKPSSEKAYLACEWCGSDTTKLKPVMPSCDECGFVEPEAQTSQTAPAMYCMQCNP
jgi:hypothetical protein